MRGDASWSVPFASEISDGSKSEYLMSESFTMKDSTTVTADRTMANSRDAEYPLVNSGIVSIEKLIPGAPEVIEKNAAKRAVPRPQPR